MWLGSLIPGSLMKLLSLRMAWFVSASLAGTTGLCAQSASSSPAASRLLDSSSIFASGVTVRPNGAFLFTSGSGGGTTGDTKSQALAYFAKLKTDLASYGFSMSDIAFVHAALVADETGKVDFDGWNAAWKEIFGTTDLPWKPAQTTIVIPKFWSPGSKISELDIICGNGSADTMMSASKALDLPVTNPNLAPFESRKGRFYRAMGVAPGTSLFFASGVGAPVVNKDAMPSSRESRGDMHTQATGVLKAISANLASVGLSFKDVVFMRAYLGPDVLNEGKFYFDDWNKAYDEFFNNSENPHKPARTSISIAGFANSTSMLEVEVIAAFPHAPELFSAPDSANANLKSYGKAEAAISSGVAVKGGSAFYFSAGVGPSVAGEMKAQALSALEKMKGQLAAAGYGLQDVVFLHAFVVAGKDGKVDRKGLGDAYASYFGSKDQPHKPARTTVAITALPNPDWKIEIEAIAAKP